MKLLQVRVTEEEYERIEKRVIELSVREGKLLNMTGGLRVILRDFLNGNQPIDPIEPIEEQKIDSKDAGQESFSDNEQDEQGGWSGINLD